MAYDIGAIVLDWTGLDQLGVLAPAVKTFDDSQFTFFQSFQHPKYQESHFAKPELEILKSKLRTIHERSLSLRLIIHGVFVQYTSSSTHLMSPFIHCLEMLFNETNKITAERHVKICEWIMSIYIKLERIHSNHYLNYNQCICDTVKYHRDNNNLNISIDENVIKQQCYKDHITPLQILLKNLHWKQRKCPSLNISNLIDIMLSDLGINESLSTLYITINDTQKVGITDINSWQCNICTLINDNAISICEACNNPKPSVRYEFLTNDQEPHRAINYKKNLLKECTKTGINISIIDYDLKINIHDLLIGHIRLLFTNSISPINIRIKDEFTKLICDIGINELISTFDKKFSILHNINNNILDDIYPLLVIHYEAKKDLIRILSLCELCKSSVILRNYLGLITDYIYGDNLSNDDIYDNHIRMKYCSNHLNATINKSGVKNPDFFIYWLSKYCLTDTKFLNYYSKSQQLPLLKDFCSQRQELKPLLYQFDLDSYEKYNSYYY